MTVFFFPNVFLLELRVENYQLRHVQDAPLPETSWAWQKTMVSMAATGSGLVQAPGCIIEANEAFAQIAFCWKILNMACFDLLSN